MSAFVALVSFFVRSARPTKIPSLGEEPNITVHGEIPVILLAEACHVFALSAISVTGSNASTPSFVGMC